MIVPDVARGMALLGIAMANMTTAWIITTDRPASYFGGIIDQAASLDPMLAMIAVMASMLGTTLARRLLESMSEQQFRTWANRIITVVASYYILYAGWLMLIAQRSIAAE